MYTKNELVYNIIHTNKIYDTKYYIIMWNDNEFVMFDLCLGNASYLVTFV